LEESETGSGEFFGALIKKLIFLFINRNGPGGGTPPELAGEDACARQDRRFLFGE